MSKQGEVGSERPDAKHRQHHSPGPNVRLFAQPLPGGGGEEQRSPSDVRGALHRIDLELMVELPRRRSSYAMKWRRYRERREIDPSRSAAYRRLLRDVPARSPQASRRTNQR